MSNLQLTCRERISIGNNVLIGSDCMIADNDFHSLKTEERINESRNGRKGIVTVPIIIEDNVFIGARSIILKGVCIGKNAIIGAGSVVSKNVPANEVWVGNPARFIRKVD